MATKEFKDGVSFYSVFSIDPEKYTVKFPEGYTCCGYCPMAYSDRLSRPRCRANDDFITHPLYAPFLPEFCVLTDTGEIIGEPPKNGTEGKEKGAKHGRA